VLSNPTHRLALERQLASWGVAVEAVDSEALALEHALDAVADGTPFDVLLVDESVSLHAPLHGTPGGVVGMTLADSVLADTPRVVLTRRGSTEAAASEHPQTVLLNRPVRQRQLFAAVARAVGRARVAEPRRLDAHAQQRPIEVSSAEPVRVLVAEDNRVNQEVARRLLARLGCEATIVGTGAEAVAASARETYDAILMDCQMPELDGYEATAAIRLREGSVGPMRTRRVPIVALTASAMPGDRERCLAAGMNDYVAKPMTLERLAEALGRWIPGRIAVVSEPSREVDGHGPEHPAEPALDTTVLAQLADEERGGDPAFVVEVIDLFLEQVAPMPDELRAAVAAGDLPTAARIVHTLQSSSGNIGAVRLQRLCRDAERLAGTDRGDGLAEMADQVLAEIERVIRALQIERQRSAA
jgi:CheY-like chemotaxis protein/HPt (histidine-containing phosphotransfer) domain-containing protein